MLKKCYIGWKILEVADPRLLAYAGDKGAEWILN
jgi:hypothetical protein